MGKFEEFLQKNVSSISALLVALLTFYFPVNKIFGNKSSNFNSLFWAVVVAILMFYLNNRTIINLEFEVIGDKSDIMNEISEIPLELREGRATQLKMTFNIKHLNRFSKKKTLFLKYPGRLQ